MNIWLNPTLLSPRPIAEYSSRCKSDDTCSSDAGEEPFYMSSSVPIIPALFKDDISNLHNHIFVCSETLHIQKCTETCWLVCHPTGEGKIAVLDAEAYAFLFFFHAPKRLHDVVAHTGSDLTSAARAATLFIRLGFLRDLDQPTPAHEPVQSLSLAAWLHVTNACNLRCNYCYVQKTTEHMDDETTLRSVDAVIRSAVKHHYRHVHLTYAGGEAMLRLPQVIATHDYALQQTHEYGLTLSASLISNGAAFPRSAIAQLKQRRIGVVISLDGIGQSHDQQRPLINGRGSFTFVDRTIARLLAGGLVPNINVTVTRRNLDQLPALLEYILQRDLPFGLSYYRDNECSTKPADLQFTDDQMISGMRAAFTYIEQHLPARSLLGSLIDKASMEAPHQYKCGVGRNYMVIDQRGGVARCQADITDTVTTIRAADPLQLIRAERRGVQAVPVDEKEGCRSCEWRYWCSGGCAMLTYHLTGRSDIKSPNCAIYKALFPDALRLEAQRLLKYQQPIAL